MTVGHSQQPNDGGVEHVSERTPRRHAKFFESKTLHFGVPQVTKGRENIPGRRRRGAPDGRKYFDFPAGGEGDRGDV